MTPNVESPISSYGQGRTDGAADVDGTGAQEQHAARQQRADFVRTRIVHNEWVTARLSPQGASTGQILFHAAGGGARTELQNFWLLAKGVPGYLRTWIVSSEIRYAAVDPVLASVIPRHEPYHHQDRASTGQDDCLPLFSSCTTADAHRWNRNQYHIIRLTEESGNTNLSRGAHHIRHQSGLKIASTAAWQAAKADEKVKRGQNHVTSA